MTIRNICILGATGSIGRNTLSVLSDNPDRYQVAALSAGKDAETMAKLIDRWQPQAVAMNDAQAAADIRHRYPRLDVLQGESGIAQIAALPTVDSVVHGITGAAGLIPAIAAVSAGKRLLLANKESLVIAGPLLRRLADRHDALIVPLDSEHNAVLQCLPDDDRLHGAVEQIWLTASGGGLRDKPIEQLPGVTPEEACHHPNWKMGRKITVDSATMMNKGLEVIEACHLFNLPLERIGVALHPQSIIHALVSYRDGSTLTQLAHPDMRVPIAHALAWPEERIPSGVPPLDPTGIGRLDFTTPDPKRYPCLELARAALRQGGTAPIVLNAANEKAVEFFLDHRLSFTGIADLVDSVLNHYRNEQQPDDVHAILATDQNARRIADQHLTRIQ